MYCLAVCSACEFINLDIKGVRFKIPGKTYAFSTDDPRWRVPAGGVPDLSCGVNGLVEDCCNPAPGLTLDCQQFPLICEEGGCVASFDYEVVQAINLIEEVPELGNTEDPLLSKVTLQEVTYDVISNSMNVDFPAVDIFVAPGNITSSKDPLAIKLVTIPGHKVGFVGANTLPTEEPGQSAFASLASDFQTPFNLIAVTKIRIEGGEAIPNGRLEVLFAGKVEAHF